MLRLRNFNSARGPHRPILAARSLLLMLAALAGSVARAQQPNVGPASIPAGALSPEPPKPDPKTEASSTPGVTTKQLRDADDAYIEGARQLQRKDIVSAEHSFARAVQLNPANRDYALALLLAREGHVSQLIKDAAQARQAGDTARSEALLKEARTIDPDNTIVSQHFAVPSTQAPDAAARHTAALVTEASLASIDPRKFPVADIASTLAGPIEFDPAPGVRSFHVSGSGQTILRDVFSAFGISVTADASVPSGQQAQLDLDNVTFPDALRVASQLTHLFAVPVQPKLALIAKDDAEDRDRLLPLVEETVYLPGITPDQMTELANLARNVFEVRQVTASPTGGDMLLRGDENLLREVNASFADLLEGGSDILFEINLYEVDKTHTVNIGATLPGSVGAFDLLSSAQTLINANQSTINQAVASGILVLNGSAGANEIKELLFLVAAGVSGSAQFTSLLGTIGTDGGLPLLGLSLASGSTFNLMLGATDARLLDSVQLRGGSGQDATFRAGSRYPIVTSTYSSGISSSLASSLSGLNINGTSVSKLLSQYLGTSSATVPQFQFEDLGITLKLSPRVLHGNEVQVKVDMKIESLAGSSINNIPVLNNRSLTSMVTIPVGNSALLASVVSTNEVGSIDGLPGISELPGFQGTDKDIEKDSTEILITITPHIVRALPFRVASRRLAAVKTSPAAQ
jgi:general secretion pathway protein D